MNSVSFNGHIYDVPGTWNELSRRQLLGIARIFTNKPMASRMRILIILLGIRWYRFRLLHYFDKINDEQRVDCDELVSFIYQSNNLTRQLIPKLSNLYGPFDNFRNLTILEFSFADTFYLQFRQNNNMDALDKMAAILYRPQRRDYNPSSPDYNGDRREEFNTAHIEARAKKLKKLPFYYKQAILLWYDGCRQALVTHHPHVFSGDSKYSESSKQGWLGVLIDMAGPKFGTVEQAAKTLLYTFMAGAERALIIAEEQEMEMQKNRNS